MESLNNNLELVSPPSGKNLVSPVSSPAVLFSCRESSKTGEDDSPCTSLYSPASVESNEVDVYSEIRDFLARIDPILDFWMEDEQLLGRFHISNESKSGKAIIFKIKTTSPYHFWVKPVYGLMKPNANISIEVKCDHKVSTVRMAMDEFLIQVAAVPLASAVMTSDLYTSSVASNLPELLDIWEKIDESAQHEDGENNKETHRLLCRFQGTLMKPSVKDGNVSQSECYLAREHTLENQMQSINLPSSSSHQREKKCCSTKRRFQALSASLAVLLFASLIYFFVFCRKNETDRK